MVLERLRHRSQVNKAEPNGGAAHQNYLVPGGVCIGRSTDDWGGRTRGLVLGAQRGLYSGGRVR